MKTIAFAANKGGVGKTRLSILTANYLGAAGFRVALASMDFNNSADLYYLRREEDGSLDRRAESKNIAEALRREANDLGDYMLPTIRKNVWIMPSSRYMSDIRSINERRLSRMTPALEGRYDFMVIDCAPTYDNLMLNAVNAADFIVTPALQDLDSLNAAVFLDYKLSTETDKRNNWLITINGYNKRFEEAESGAQKEYINEFMARFDNMAERSAWLPWARRDMNEIKDRRRLLSEGAAVVDENGQKAVVNKALHNAAANFAESFIDERLLSGLRRPEAF
jgi:chromosome partitioning protein